MREDGLDVVRSPMRPTAHPRRRIEERLGLRFPGLLDRLSRAVWRLPARSRLRQALVRRFLRIAWEAFNREDLEACFMLYAEDCECDWDPRWPSVGIPLTVHGRANRIRIQRELNDEWRQVRFTPEEIIQFSDHVLSIGRMSGIGPASGIDIDTEWVADFTVRGGRVVHERISITYEDGLAAAGLSA